MTRITLAYAFTLVAFLLVADFGGLESLALTVNELPLVDKLIHFFMFGLLALLANMSLIRQRRWNVAGSIATGSIIVLIVATVEECSNVLVEYRTCSVADLAANYLGIVCVGILPLMAWPWSPVATSPRPAAGD